MLLLDTSKEYLLLSLATALCYVIGVVLYRIYLHPLSKYPGPFWGRVTNLYAIYHSYKGDRHIRLHELHAQHGDYVRWKPNLVTINNKAAVKGLFMILTFSPKLLNGDSELYAVGRNVQKSRRYTVFPGPTLFSTIDKKKHSVKRRVYSHAFTESALRSMVPNILMHIRELCDIITSQSSTTEGWVGDMGNWAIYLTSDILGDLAFGKDFGMLRSEENRDIPVAMESSTVLSSLSGEKPIIEHSGLSYLLFPRLTLRTAAFRKLGRQQGALRAKTETDRHDFLSYLLNAKDNVFTTYELLSESAGLMVAGTDTTATQIAANYFYLAKNPDKLARLVQELRVNFDTVEDIVLGSKLDGCKYLNACIDETLRIAPSVPGLLPREVVDEGVHINGEYFPPGVELSVPIYALHHKDEYFEDPHRFVPERWLVDEMSNMDLKTAHMTFSVGNRACIGRRVAYIELQLLLARSLWLFDIEFVNCAVEQVAGDGMMEEYKLIDHFVSARRGPTIRFRNRK